MEAGTRKRSRLFAFPRVRRAQPVPRSRKR
ncbi:hypothetical protein STPYR_12127 [uncultured Stenotrophomonas sp.]|uniref:Uncharacterized protein n=1 Tax=uncultured Stenotrophomonas sp. TaxID=165438 RepID=A0A1Y5QA26_9GAMM|nr:hypothetical protein STPYR_12127 [uncultured Stenotrophomonas sp.]